MTSASLIHDSSFSLATAGTVILRQSFPHLSEDDQRGFFGRLYEACKSVLTDYEDLACRMQQRLQPVRNGGPPCTGG